MITLNYCGWTRGSDPSDCLRTTSCPPDETGSLFPMADTIYAAEKYMKVNKTHYFSNCNGHNPISSIHISSKTTFILIMVLPLGSTCASIAKLPHTLGCRCKLHFCFQEIMHGQLIKHRTLAMADIEPLHTRLSMWLNNHSSIVQAKELDQGWLQPKLC